MASPSRGFAGVDGLAEPGLAGVVLAELARHLAIR